jgi:hypothetical protein
MSIIEKEKENKKLEKMSNPSMSQLAVAGHANNY